MMITMKKNAKKINIEKIIERIRIAKLTSVVYETAGVKRICVLGDSKKYEMNNWNSFNDVESFVALAEPYKLANRKMNPGGSIIRVGNIAIGDGNFTIIAGPCSVETEEQIMKIAKILKNMGVKIMRASAFKPRTSPYSFQGLGMEGLKLLKKVREKVGILVETEVMDVRDVKIAAEYVDLIRVGTRNMQNFDLLKEIGQASVPVILKRGFSATIEEFLMSAEYIMAHGNKNVILCERGIRTIESKEYRNTLDITAVPVLKKLTHLPVIIDPSHAAGNRELIIPLSKAAAAIGADGLLVEVHHDPDNALSDGKQSLYPEQMQSLLNAITPLCEINKAKVI